MLNISLCQNKEVFLFKIMKVDLSTKDLQINVEDKDGKFVDSFFLSGASYTKSKITGNILTLRKKV